MAQGDTQEVHRVLILGPAPQFANELTVRPNLAGMVNQDLEQIILGRGQPQRCSSHKHFPPREIDFEIAHGKNYILCWTYVAQGSAHPRQQLWHGKWLRQIVMRTTIERGNFLGYFVMGRDNDNRGDRPPSQTPYDVLAFHVGQADIEKNQIRPRGVDSLHCLFPAARLINAVTFLEQYSAESALARLFLVHQKYSWTYWLGYENSVFDLLNDVRNGYTLRDPTIKSISRARAW